MMYDTASLTLIILGATGLQFLDSFIPGMIMVGMGFLLLMIKSE